LLISPARRTINTLGWWPGPDELDGCTEGTLAATEFIMLVEAIEAYEAERWPDGKIPGGKG